MVCLKENVLELELSAGSWPSTNVDWSADASPLSLHEGLCQ